MKGSETFAQIVFWLFAAVAVLPAFLILVARDIVRQAFLLLASLSGFAGLYLLLGMLFVVQVLKEIDRGPTASH